MSTLLAYVERYGHLTFKEKRLNEVDLLILNELVYFPLGNFVSSSFDLDSAIRLDDFAVQFTPYSGLFNKMNWVLTTQNRIDLLNHIAITKRYRDIQLFAFKEQIDIDIELQFAAVSLVLPVGVSKDEPVILVSFRGTDDSLIGWKEDANMAFQPEVPSQKVAAWYLQKTAAQHPLELIVAGHSKGGNLAVFASTFAQSAVQERIRAIYSFDGPGLHPASLETSGYKLIQNRIHLYRPEDSIIGMMLYHTAVPHVIKSRKIGFAQHLVTNWLVEEDRLHRCNEVSTTSQLFDQTLREWTASYSINELEFFVNQIFNLLLKTNTQSLIDITDHKIHFLKQFTQEISQLDTDVRQILDKQLAQFVKIALNSMMTNRRQQYQDTLQIFSSWLGQLSAFDSVKKSLPLLRQELQKRQASDLNKEDTNKE